MQIKANKEKRVVFQQFLALRSRDFLVKGKFMLCVQVE
jgi:hypothetical protein